MPKTNKTQQIKCRVEPEIKEAFEKHCRDNFTTASQVLYTFINTTLKHSGRKISLSEYREMKS